MPFKIKNLLDHSYSRNVSFAFFMGLFCVTLGSASTALFVASCVILIFFNSKIPVKEIWREAVLLGKKIPLVLIYPAFYFLVVITSARGENILGDTLFVAGSYWQFLVMIPAAIGLYYLSKDVNFAGLFSLGCRWGLVFVVPLSLIQIYFFNLRPEGILSNALIFASLCVTAAGFAMIEWREDNQTSRNWGWILFIAGVVASLLTFSRGMLLPIGAMIAIAIFYRFKTNSKFKLDSKTLTIICVSVAAIIGASVSTDNGWRILNKRVIEPIEMYKNGNALDRSISQRLDMQFTGFEAFKQNPFFGYGVQNAVKQSNKVSEDVLGRKTEYTYTHLHNDYLTHAVGGGVMLLLLFITVIISPVLMTWSLRNDKSEASLFYFALVLSGAYASIAMTNIVFHNDQLTTMFCIASTFIMVRRLQIIKGVKEVRIPHIPTIANGINPIGLLPEEQLAKNAS